jgi:peroxiredoxin Q/BCP
MAKGPQPGDAAPDFELEGTKGNFKLADQRGKRVMLLFYPGDNTPVCTKQFCSYRDNSAGMDALDAVVVGISPQGLDSHNGFVEKHSLNVPLLADLGKKVAAAYGMTGALGAKRGVVIIDAEGVVRYRHDHRIGLDFQTVEELTQALASVPA